MSRCCRQKLWWEQGRKRSSEIRPSYIREEERKGITVVEKSPDNMILFGESSLRTAVQNFVAHYYSERNHQGLDSELGHLK